MKVLFLLPPSEWKNKWWNYNKEIHSFDFKKPCDIATLLTEKELKCNWNRFEEWLFLNKTLCSWEQKEFEKAIERYSWVMYSAIDYKNMSKSWKKFFEDNFLIFSWMYGIVKPLDIIWNYKLPLEKADLYKFWWDIIPDSIIKLNPDFIVNLLPINYAKLIWLWTNCSRHKKKLEKILNSWTKVININFLKKDGKKISHGVKKIKGEFIKNICENNIKDYKNFGWEVIKNNNWVIDVNLVSE